MAKNIAATPSEKLTVKYMPLAELHLSKTNPRATMDETDLKGLALSIKFRGILQPLVVTPEGEIVSGARRFRAAKLAGLTEVPCRIMDLKGEELMTAQVIENKQRADVHPLEEAIGFQKLLKKPNQTIDTVAANVGVSAQHVRLRIALLDLSDKAQNLYKGGTLQIGHALELCRLTKEQQDEIVRNIGGYGGQVVTVPALREQILRTFFLSLSKAPWELTDPDLDKKAGPCVTCKKRTKADAVLFADLVTDKSADQCRDPQCYENKAGLYVIQTLDQAKKKGTKLVPVATSYVYGEALKKLPSGTLKQDDFVILKKSDKCDYACSGLVVYGPNKGDTIRICADKKCPDHGDTQKRENQRDPSTGLTKAEMQERKAERQTRTKIALAVVEKLKNPGREEYLLCATSMFSRLDNATRNKVVGLQNWWEEGVKPSERPHAEEVVAAKLEMMDEAQLQKFLVFMALSIHMEHAPYSYSPHPLDEEGDGEEQEEKATPDPLLDTAKRLGIDVDAITAEVKAKLTPKPKPTEAEAKPKQARAKKVGK